MTKEATTKTSNQTNKEKGYMSVEEFLEARDIKVLDINPLKEMSKEQLIFIIEDYIERLGDLAYFAEETENAYWLYRNVKEAPEGPCSLRRKDSVAHAHRNLIRHIGDQNRSTAAVYDDLAELRYPGHVRHNQ